MMRVWVPTALAVLLCAAAPSQPPQQQNEPSSEARAAAAERETPHVVVQVVPAPKTAAEATEEKRDNDRKSGIEEKALVTNVALAVFAFLQLVVTGITLFGLRHAKVAAQAADKAADAAKASIDHLAVIERAYVFGGVDKVTAAGAQANFELILHNAGRTPARIREVHVAVAADLELDPRKWPATPDYRLTKAYTTDTIFEGGARSPQIDFKDMPIAGVCFGYVLYDDIFKKPHFSRFCMSYSGVEKRASTYGNEEWNLYD